MRLVLFSSNKWWFVVRQYNVVQGFLSSLHVVAFSMGLPWFVGALMLQAFLLKMYVFFV